MITSRRSLFGFGAALIAAPVIVRVASLMPVSAAAEVLKIHWPWPPYALTVERINKFKQQLMAESLPRLALDPTGAPAYRVFVPYRRLSA